MAPLATLAGLAVVTVGYPTTVRSLARFDLLPPRFSPARLRVGAGIQWLLALVVLGLVVVVEDRPLASIGVTRPTLRGLLVAGVVVGGTVLVYGVVVRLAGVEHLDDAVVFSLAQPAHRSVGLAVTGGVTEELLYRGYLMERTIEVTASPLAAAALSVVAFLLVYAIGRDVRAVLSQSLGLAVGLAVAYLLVRNVVVLATVHAALTALVNLSTDPAEVLDRMEVATVDDRVLALVEWSPDE